MIAGDATVAFVDRIIRQLPKTVQGYPRLLVQGIVRGLIEATCLAHGLPVAVGELSDEHKNLVAGKIVKNIVRYTGAKP